MVQEGRFAFWVLLDKNHHKEKLPELVALGRIPQLV